MTTLYVLGSGSGGNCLALEHEGAALLIDAGFSAREIARRGAAVGFDVRRIIAIALTHEHGDHTRGVARLARTLRVPVLTAPGTWESLRPRMPTARHLALQLMGTATAGAFTIESCRTSHDAAEPVALAVTCGGSRIGVAYDLGRPTASVRWLLRELDALVIEANHDEVMLRTSDYPPAVQERIVGSGGHLSNRAAAELIGEVMHPGLGTVVLAHLSARCNTPEAARAAVEPALAAAGFTGQLHVALQDHPLPSLAVRPAGITPVQVALGL